MTHAALFVVETPPRILRASDGNVELEHSCVSIAKGKATGKLVEGRRRIC